MGIKSPKWVDTIPPRSNGNVNARRKSGSKFRRLVKVLKENPNRWAEVASFQQRNKHRAMAQRLRDAGLQVSVRQVGGGWTRVYARFNTFAASTKKSVKK